MIREMHRPSRGGTKIKFGNNKLSGQSQHEFNVNCDAKVKLTKDGLDTLFKHTHKFDQYIPEDCRKEYTPGEDGYYTFPLWDLMCIFGHMFVFGSPSIPFENNIIIIIGE